MSATKTLMVQGCTSDAGKSTLVAGLCRLFARQHQSVAPFKPQNMALNSAVTADGGEIGRAQALQAVAAKISPSVHMNPVLLKPSSDTGAQVILQGKSIGNLNAMNYHAYKPRANKAVLASFAILSDQFDTVLVEGAGSPAEVNLRENDIANMGFAEQVDCPVILIADIDKGGVFAHIIGTLACLSEREVARIKGFVINRFRGDLALLEDGLTWLTKQTGKPVLGVLPYLHGLHLDAEDALCESDISDLDKSPTRRLKVIVPLLPHMSNHTDFEALRLHPNVDFEYVKHQDDVAYAKQNIPVADLIILPGSKNVAFDLAWLKKQGWDTAIKRHCRYGGKVIGICGGLQMLGKWIDDPHGIESGIKTAQFSQKQPGLGLLGVETTLKPTKTLVNRVGELQLFGAEHPTVKVKGYEIHSGVTRGLSSPHLHSVMMAEDGSPAAWCSDDNQILVSYWHGLFDEPDALASLLSWAGAVDLVCEPFDINAVREAQLERLADTLEAHLDMAEIQTILDESVADAVPSLALALENNAFLPHQIEAVYQTIAQRRDMRHFLNTPIAPALFERILSAGHQAPSVGLMQPWRFIRITDNALRVTLHGLVEAERALTASALNKCKDEFMKLKVEGILDCAEVVVVSLSDQREKEVFGRRTLPEMDVASVGCAIQNMALAARAVGIGMGWVSLFDPDEVAQCLKLPTANLHGISPSDAAKPIAILCFGHVKAFYDKPMLEQENWRQPLLKQQVTFYNEWGQLAKLTAEDKAAKERVIPGW